MNFDEMKVRVSFFFCIYHIWSERKHILCIYCTAVHVYYSKILIWFRKIRMNHFFFKTFIIKVVFFVCLWKIPVSLTFSFVYKTIWYSDMSIKLAISSISPPHGWSSFLKLCFFAKIQTVQTQNINEEVEKWMWETIKLILNLEVLYYN